ncbi:Angiopoietin-related protein 1 like protein [Argiope bruennichi]|uniref:Angiopoietin-related protein 1 like protein n=1 Tax=Argiope bruennichi TaxID=94029 RepID=A0A8T0F421_ARGBR|nr:Angiopoietin-related protein 1 like protein [Argiope bruennichi]
MQNTFRSRRQGWSETFRCQPEICLTDSSYTIDISGYSGNATDAMHNHNGCVFSTKDREAVESEQVHLSGWWHGDNFFCNLNGIYQPGRDGPQCVTGGKNIMTMTIYQPLR